MDRLREARPAVEIEIIEVLTHPGRALREGIFMIPALIVGRQRWFHVPALSEILAALDSER